MQITFTPRAQIAKRPVADLIILPFWQEKKGAEPAAHMKGFHQFFQMPVEEKDFRGKEGEVLPLYLSKEKEKRVLLLGLGNKKDSFEESFRRAYATVTKWCRSKNLSSVNILIPEGGDLERSLEVICEGLLLANYTFDALKGDSFKKEPHQLLNSICFIGGPSDGAKRCERIKHVIDSVYFARDLVSGNADDVTPEFLAEKAKEIGKEFNSVKTIVLTLKQLRQEKMGLLLAVSRAAVCEPTMSILEYNGNPGSKEKIALVGKGITYDTGGLSLKIPGTGMETMKADMSGAATVLGTMQAAAKLKLKVNLIGVVPAAENAIGSRSYKPGDVYCSYSGKTVEIISADAEGRLILADALSYVQKNYAPSKIIDLATLTGSIVGALGDDITGLFCNDRDLAEGLIQAGERTEEPLWRMPLHAPYLDMLKSKFADIQNSGARKAGAVTAALFLQEFVHKGTAWAHLDIAGTAYLPEPAGYNPTIATGVGIRLLIEFLSHANSKK